LPKCRRRRTSWRNSKLVAAALARSAVTARKAIEAQFLRRLRGRVPMGGFNRWRNLPSGQVVGKAILFVASAPRTSTLALRRLERVGVFG
jgi:hypothetical protein